MTPGEQGRPARHAMPGGHSVEVGAEADHGWVRIRRADRSGVLELRIEDDGIRILAQRGALSVGAADRPLHLDGSTIRVRARDGLRLESRQGVVVDAATRIDLWTGER